MRLYLDGTELGLPDYGLGARIQNQSGSRPYTLRGEGPGFGSREIFSGSMPYKRSSSRGTGLEAGRGVTEPGATLGEITLIGTGNNSDSAQLHPSEGRPLGYSHPMTPSLAFTGLQGIYS
jgi:hypothetical protein